jgi:DNA-directed RNA polymerase subunit RPC12/RpoP
MPERQFITGIAGVQTLDVIQGNSFEIEGIGQIQPDTACPKCSSKRLRTKSTHQREFKHALLGQKMVLLRVKIPKLLCKVCEAYFMLRLPGILPKKRATEQFSAASQEPCAAVFVALERVPEKPDPGLPGAGQNVKTMAGTDGQNVEI